MSITPEERLKDIERDQKRLLRAVFGEDGEDDQRSMVARVRRMYGAIFGYDREEATGIKGKVDSIAETQRWIGRAIAVAAIGMIAQALLLLATKVG